MQGRAKFRSIASGIAMVVMSASVWAEDNAPNFASASAGYYSQSVRSYILASNDDGIVGKQAGSTTPSARVVEVSQPLLSGSKAHQYLGLGTLALVGLTAMTAPDDDEENKTSGEAKTTGTHQSLGRAAAAMATASVASGLLYHWDDFFLEDGWRDPDNLHWMLGSAGAVAMLYAVSKAPDSGHSGTGILGGLAMGAAVKLTW